MRKVIRYFLMAFAYSAVLYPVFVRFRTFNWTLGDNFLMNLFPMFGLAAFATLWLHIMSGVFEPWLRRYIDLDRFVHITSILVLVFIILHPLFLLIGLDFNFSGIFLYGKTYIWLAIVGWILLITYDVGKILNRYNFFARNWNKILFISTIGFLFTFFHSLGVGSDLQSGALRIIWIFYGVTAILGTIYIYGIKKFLR